MFLRGILLMHGSVSDPQKSYRIDLSFSEKTVAEGIKNLFDGFSINLKLIKRKDKYVLYSKNFETIADIVALVGAKNASFQILNTKILKEIRNDVNRARNCDSANIDKSVKANEKYLIAIRYLIETGKISLLPDHLKEMALKRVEFPDISFTELGKKFSPPISKSGVFHRLEKILEYYENNKN
jgi:DNA-binding protein WhiA